MSGNPGEERPRHQRSHPHLHVRAPKRIVGIGGECDPLAKIIANRAGLLRVREQIEATLAADEGLASAATYRETDGRRYEIFVQRADRPERMGEPREPEPPDYSMFT